MSVFFWLQTSLLLSDEVVLFCSAHLKVHLESELVVEIAVVAGEDYKMIYNCWEAQFDGTEMRNLKEIKNHCDLVSGTNLRM